MKTTTLLTTCLLAISALATPIPIPSYSAIARRAPVPSLSPVASGAPVPSIAPTVSRRSNQGAVDILLKIAPTSNTCSGAPFPAECATASDAADPLIASFTKYQINTAGEQVALLSLMAFESGDFKYNKNHFPGRPGQGCRNMMMPNFVSQYAATLGLSNADPAGLLDQVNQAGGDWGAAAWFYSTQCSADVKSGLQAGTKAGWSAFISGCVQTTVTDDRAAGWTRAAQAFGLSGN